MLQLAQGAVVIVQSHWPADLCSHMGGGHILRPRISLGHLALADADGIHARAQVHAPDGLGAELTDIELELRCLEVAAPTGQEVLQVLAVARHVVLVEHVVLALVPHEPFQAILDLELVQVGQCRPDGLQCQGIHFEANGLVRIPVTAEMRATGSHLDNGNGRLDVAGDLACEAQLRTNDIIDVL